jgi:PAS domain S-box-containing protein
MMDPQPASPSVEEDNPERPTMQNEIRRAVDTIPGLVWSALPDGQFDFLNQRWCEYTGLSLEEARASGWQAAICPEDLPGLLAYWRSLLAAGQPGETEARLRRFDGTYRWFLVRAVPLFDEAGNLVKWYGQSTDIDDRKRAEALLAGEKRLLEMVAWGCSLPVVLDTLCTLVEDTASGCHCSVLLIDPTGTKLQHGAAPSLPPSFNDTIHGRPMMPYWGPCAMAVHRKTQVIVSDVTLDKRWEADEWCSLALELGLRSCWTTPILSLAGKVLGTFAIYQHEPGSPTALQQDLIEQFTHIASITIERAQGETALKRSEAFLAEAQRLSSTGSFSWRVATDEITWSEQTYRIYEIDPAVPVTFELVGTRVHPEDIPWFQELVDQARRDGRDLEFEHRLRMPDGSVKHLHVVAHAASDQADQLEYIGAVQDVTERRLSEDALSKVRSELAHVARVTTLGALTASIAHEVNQPLSGIVTNASTSLRMLADDPPNVEGARETARRTIRDANRASDVIARLRTLFRKKSAAAESVDLNEATRDVIALVRSELQRTRVILRAELADDLPLVTGDRIQLQQVVLNLLLNASEAMSDVEDRSRQVVIRTERDQEDHVRLTVQDTGVGFDPQNLSRLFEAFYTTKSSGMGIGLSISRFIVESHQGRLWAAPHDGPGATFSFSIPCNPSRVAAHPMDESETPVLTNASSSWGET